MDYNSIKPHNDHGTLGAALVVVLLGYQQTVHLCSVDVTTREAAVLPLGTHILER